MSPPKNTDEKPKKNRSLLGALFTQQERDEDYLPELKTQWHGMDKEGRIKFIIGIIIGLVLFIGAVFGVYYLLSLIIS